MLNLLLVSADRGSLSDLATAIKNRDDADLLEVTAGETALVCAADTVFDLIVADENLGDMTGLEFADKLVTVNPLINCALVSSLSSDDFHEASEGLGVMTQLPIHPGREQATELLARLMHIKGLTGG